MDEIRKSRFKINIVLIYLKKKNYLRNKNKIATIKKKSFKND